MKLIYVIAFSILFLNIQGQENQYNYILDKISTIRSNTDTIFISTKDELKLFYSRDPIFTTSLLDALRDRKTITLKNGKTVYKNLPKEYKPFEGSYEELMAQANMNLSKVRKLEMEIIDSLYQNDTLIGFKTNYCWREFHLNHTLTSNLSKNICSKEYYDFVLSNIGYFKDTNKNKSYNIKIISIDKLHNKSHFISLGFLANSQYRHSLLYELLKGKVVFLETNRVGNFIIYQQVSFEFTKNIIL